MAHTTVPLTDIRIRTDIRPGDMGFIIHRHGTLYAAEYNYGLSFEIYVARTICEFYEQYDPARDRAWVCEHHDRIIGFLVLQHRPHNSAQLRYFFLEKAYRGNGLSKKLMDLYMEFFRECGYDSTYLWTAHEHVEAESLYARYGFTLTEELASTTFGRKVIERRYEYRSGKV